VQNLNLRHIYSKGFLIFGAVFARLASEFEKITNMDIKKKICKKSKKRFLISNPLKKFLKNAPKKL
jgi:hypothetical protein